MANRDAASYRLRRYRDEVGDELGDVIDLRTLYPEARRTIVRPLAEVDVTTNYKQTGDRVPVSPT